MSYTKSLTETQNENLDVRIFEIASKFGERNLDTMQWTFDNQQLFLLSRALLDSEEAKMLAGANVVNGWQTGAPPTKHNDYKEYIVAVRRAHDPEKVYVFAANYANNYDDELHDQDGNKFVANGWYDVNEDTGGEFDNMFSQTLQEGDEVLGWQHLPKYRI